MITQERFDANVPPAQQTDSAVYIQLVDDSAAGVAAARPALQQIADAVPGAEVQDVGEYKKAQTAQADQFLLVVYVLLALALVIAIVGVVNTLLLSVYRAHPRARAAPRGRDDPATGAIQHPMGVGHHRLIGTITGLVTRHGVRVGPRAAR